MPAEDLPEPTLRSPAQRAGWAFAVEHPDQATHPAIAEAAGVAESTVAKWLKAWRAELGEDLFRGEVADARAEQTMAARQVAEQTWLDLRTAEARNCGVTASQIRGRLLQLLPVVATTRVDRGEDGKGQPILVHGPKASEVKALADAVATLLESAELLVGNPTRHTRRSVPSDQWQPPGIPPGEKRTDDEKRATILDLTSKLRERQTG